MKNLSLFCFLFACSVFQSCKEKPKDSESKELDDKPVKVECYKAFYEKDTLSLKINTLRSGKVSGNLVMKVFNKAEKVGTIAGELRGDTLFVAYSFVSGKDKATYKNPMALLKRDKELILGNGKIETYLGTSYFAKGQPIDFDNVKYKFTSVDCTEK